MLETTLSCNGMYTVTHKGNLKGRRDRPITFEKYKYFYGLNGTKLRLLCLTTSILPVSISSLNKIGMYAYKIGRKAHLDKAVLATV